MNDTVIEEIDIQAPPERVFSALTDPQQLLAWWGDDSLYRCTQWTADLRVGGKWRAEGESAQGESFAVEGEYVRVESPSLLIYTWNPSWESGPPTTVQFEFRRTDSGTRLTLTHSGFVSETATERQEGGWKRVLGWLCSHVEQRQAA
ncbi:MAG: SRPBCC domain-containing protein [Methylococcaceae bacterium]|nr:SRPBCC domain-containing protein [Methylococcaceae bacterium]